MPHVNENERSWAIDLITEINLWLAPRNILIKRAGGESTLKSGTKSLFPDVLLFGDSDKGHILQGWELKMPDTPLSDEELIKNAKLKAKLLSLNSFLLWNVSSAVLYKIEDNDSLTIIKNWNNLSHIKTREEAVQSKSEISLMLNEILNDLNGFISSGDVKSTSVVTVLSNEAIYNLIQKNLSSYVEILKNTATSDSPFFDEIILWWRYAKNDYPEEKDKFVVLARNNLLFLINKFLFAHILKSYHANAGIIDTIDNSIDVNSALEIFNGISERCDFWNIFQTQKGEELITANIWSDILSFNGLLKEFNFSGIDKSLLHDLISSVVYRNKRKFAGQFTTPPELAKFIVRLTVRDKTLSAIDPCCGTGTIAREIYNFKKESFSIEQSIGTTWASDKFSLPLQMAMFNLADPEALGFVIRVFKNDASKLSVGQNIELHEPFTGSLINERLPEIGYIISNLPFVRQEDLAVLNPDIKNINTTITEKLGRDFVLDGKSDLYAYLPFYFWNILGSNGIASIIISNSWLGTSWGEIFYKALLGFFNIENIIISSNGRWFNNAKVVSTILTIKKKDQPGIAEVDSNVKFIVVKNKLSEYQNETLDEFAALLSSGESVDDDDISIYTYNQNQISEILSLGLNRNSFFVNNNWLLSLKDKLVKISTLFDVERGERRGWDKLFYPANNNNIEPDYLKPVLKTPRSLVNMIATPDALAFCCNKSKDELEELGHIGALDWINRFEGQSNEKGVPLTTSLKRAGINWYTMSPSTLAEVVTNINFGDRLFFARFEESTFVNQRLVRFTKKTNAVDVKLCHALLNSIVGLYYIEAMGTGRGDGALDLSAKKIKTGLHIINPTLISEANKGRILALFRILESRTILPIKDELEQDDRINFDNAVLESIGCVEYKEQIKNSLLTLYNIRASVNG